MNVREIAIVGGGPGGLMTAYTLQKWATEPYRLTIFEASGRMGGKILTPRFGTVPATYEAGAAEFYDYSGHDDDPLKELIEELGLPIHRMEGTSAVLRGHPIANLDDLADRFGPATAEALREFDRTARDAITPGEFYHHDEEGLGDPLVKPGFDRLVAKIPDPTARDYLLRFIHSDLATEPVKTSIAYGLHNYLMNDPAYMGLYGIAGGNEALPRELARRIAAEVRLEHRVFEVARTPSGRLRVTFDADGGKAQQEFDSVVLALPHDALGRVRFAGERLSAAMAKHLGDYHHPAHYLRVTIAFRENFWSEHLHGSYCMLEAFDGCCLYDESSRNPGSRYPVLGWLLGGDAALALSDESDDALIERVLAELPPHLSHGRSRMIEGRVHRWLGAVNALPGGLHPRTVDQRHRPEPVEHPHLFVVGDYLFDSTLNGVLDSATHVALWIVALLRERPGGREWSK
jgi:monoamine oxidase